jgi:hypothetical protein
MNTDNTKRSREQIAAEADRKIAECYANASIASRLIRRSDHEEIRSIILAALNEWEQQQDLKAVDLLRLILPLAKGYAATHRVGSNEKYISEVEEFLNETPATRETVYRDLLPHEALQADDEFKLGNAWIPLSEGNTNIGKRVGSLSMRYRRRDLLISSQSTESTAQDKPKSLAGSQEKTEK